MALSEHFISKSHNWQMFCMYLFVSVELGKMISSEQINCEIGHVFPQLDLLGQSKLLHPLWPSVTSPFRDSAGLVTGLTYIVLSGWWLEDPSSWRQNSHPPQVPPKNCEKVLPTSSAHSANTKPWGKLPTSPSFLCGSRIFRDPLGQKIWH